MAAMLAGGNRKNGLLWVADGSIDTSSLPRLSHIRAQNTTSSAVIERRPQPSVYMVTELLAQLEEAERKQQEDLQHMQAMLAAQNQAWGARMAAQRLTGRTYSWVFMLSTAQLRQRCQPLLHQLLTSAL